MIKLTKEKRYEPKKLSACNIAYIDGKDSKIIKVWVEPRDVKVFKKLLDLKIQLEH